MQYKSMKISMIVGALSLASLFNVAHAGLISGNYIYDDESIGVAVVYDTESKLTWLQDALSYDVPGKGGKDRWNMVTTWAQGLDLDDVAGADGWRLPVMLNGNTTSEFSNLIKRSDFDDAGFINIQDDDYWTGTSFTDGGVDKAYVYNTLSGEKTLKQSSKRYGWAVIDGDFANLNTSDIPEPSTVAIFGLSLLGLVARRSKK